MVIELKMIDQVPNLATRLPVIFRLNEVINIELVMLSSRELPKGGRVAAKQQLKNIYILPKKHRNRFLELLEVSYYNLWMNKKTDICEQHSKNQLYTFTEKTLIGKLDWLRNSGFDFFSQLVPSPKFVSRRFAMLHKIITAILGSIIKCQKTFLRMYSELFQTPKMKLLLKIVIESCLTILAKRSILEV